MTTENPKTCRVEDLPCLNLSLRMAARVMNRIYDSFLSQCDLTGGQFSILYVLKIKGVATNKQLQSVLALEQTTMTRNLKPLIREGYISVTPGVEDKRQKDLSLTAEGKTIFEQAKPLWLAAQKQIAEELGPDHVQQLIGISHAVVEME